MLVKRLFLLLIYVFVLGFLVGLFASLKNGVGMFYVSCLILIKTPDQIVFLFFLFHFHSYKTRHGKTPQTKNAGKHPKTSFSQLAQLCSQIAILIFRGWA